MAKRPRDPAQLAKQVFDIAIGDVEDTVSESKRRPSAKRKGGLKGGKARAESLRWATATLQHRSHAGLTKRELGKCTTDHTGVSISLRDTISV